MFKNEIWEQTLIQIHEAKELPSFLWGHFPVWVVYPSTKGQPKKNLKQKQNGNRTQSTNWTSALHVSPLCQGLAWDPGEEQAQQRGKENQNLLTLGPSRPEMLLSLPLGQGCLDAVGLWHGQEDNYDFYLLPLGTWTYDGLLTANWIKLFLPLLQLRCWQLTALKVFYVLGTLLNSVYAISHLILKWSLWDRSYYSLILWMGTQRHREVK